MAKDRIEIEIILKGAAAGKELKSFSKDAAHGLKEVKDEAKAAAGGLKGAGDASGGLGKSLDGLKVAAIATAAAFAAWKGLQSVVSFLGDAGKEAEAAEWSLRGFRQVLVSMKRETGGFEQSIVDLSQALQEQTGYEDDAILTAAKFLSTYQQISNEAMPRALQLTMDIARGWGVDLTQAANMVGKAAMGMTGELRRYGITVDENTYKSRGFLGVMDEIEAQVKGQAAAYRETTSGLKEWLTAVWGSVKEQFGIIVNQVLDPFREAAGEVLTELAKELEKWVKTVDLKTWAAEAATKFKELAFVSIPKLIEQLDLLIPKITTGLQNAGKTFAALKHSIDEVLLSIKLTIDAIRLFYALASGKPLAAIEGGQKLYDDLAAGIEKIKAANKDVADDVKANPIKPQVDNEQPKQSLDELLAWYKQYKAEMENQPIKVRIIRETVVAGEGSTYDYGKRLGGLIRRQLGGAIPGYGGGDQVRTMLEPGEFVMRKEAVRSLGVDMLNALNRGSSGGGSQGYFVLDLRGGGKSYPLTVQKDDVADALLEALRRKELIQG